MKPLFIFCATCCFLALLKLPIAYYTLLRVIVSLGGMVAIYASLRNKTYLLAFGFTIAAVLFNPLFPVYLHRKLPWMPIDIVVGLLFLLLAFWKKKAPLQEEKIIVVAQVPKIRTRDRIIGAANGADEVETPQIPQQTKGKFLKLYLTFAFNRAKKNQKQNH